MNDYAIEDAIALQCFVEGLRNHSDLAQHRAAAIIERQAREVDELRHRLRWARHYLCTIGKSDPAYAMAAVVAGITETLADETEQSSEGG